MPECPSSDCQPHDPVNEGTRTVTVRLILARVQIHYHLLQITVSSPNKPDVVTKEVDRSLQKIGRSLAGDHIPSIAKAVFANLSPREHMVEKVVYAVGNECASLCSKSAQPATEFCQRKLSLGKRVSELKQKCPILFRLFSYIVRHTDHRNASKQGEKHYPGICMTTAILLKERNREMSGIQAFFSLSTEEGMYYIVYACVCIYNSHLILLIIHAQK